jgi:hypothetical protein
LASGRVEELNIRDRETPKTRSPLWLKRRGRLTLGVVVVKILSRSRPEGRGIYVNCGIREQNNFFSFCSREKRNFAAMPQRRRDRPMPDLAVEREMRELCAKLDSMETAQRHTVNAGDINEDESENEARHEGEEVAIEDAADEHLFRVVSRIGAR